MPTVMRIGSLRVLVYPHDHRPAHVHGIGQGHEAIFELNAPDGPVTSRGNYGFNQRDLARIMRALDEHLPELIDAWEGIHGNAEGI